MQENNGKFLIKHHIVIRHIVKVLPFRFNIVYTLKELDKRCLKKRKMHLFKQNWMENKFRFFVGPFSSFSSHVSRHKAIALDFWDIADFRASAQFSGLSFLPYLGQNLQ